MGGRSSSSGLNNSFSASEAFNNANTFRTDRTLVSKSQVDELTADYTPEMFLGNKFKDLFTGTGNNLRQFAEDNMPQELNIGGYTFQAMGNPILSSPTVIMLDYQSIEPVGNEFPVLQIGIEAKRTRGGRIVTRIIRDGYANKTRFW